MVVPRPPAVFLAVACLYLSLTLVHGSFGILGGRERWRDTYGDTGIEAVSNHKQEVCDVDEASVCSVSVYLKVHDKAARPFSPS